MSDTHEQSSTITSENKPKCTTSKPKKRCSFPGCKKKISIVDREMGKCLCNGIYCSNHRAETAHSCTFDWGHYQKSLLTEKLNSEKCVARQIEVI